MLKSRAHNFSAGPAVLPLEVIHELQEALPNYNNVGLGLMEMSHRSKDFDDIIVSANRRLRTLLNIPKEYEVLFLQGGASLQFYMSALNLLNGQDNQETSAYINTGTWSTKAIKEAKRCGDVTTVWEPKSGVFNSVPTNDEYTIPTNSVYVHYTSNNTIYGTQFQEIPDSSVPLIGDYSSDIASGPLDVSKHAVIYAGAQKNLGPSGVTAVILSPWAVERSRQINSLMPCGLPSMLNYGLMVDKNSMFNTPNTFGIFALDRMLSWLERQGGVDAIYTQNRAKANSIYEVLDSSDFWVPHAARNSRSMMNITWRLASTDLEPLLLREAEKNQLMGLKGHRSVGGLRASIYNACSAESVESLVAFLKDFELRHG
jgi:phosphoserine aminotransferase